MAVTSGPCPNCGGSIEFRAGSSLSLVCKYCKHVVVRTDRDLRNLGRVADVTFGDTALAPGDRGTFRGRSFSIEGRLVLQHPQGGTWEEYYALFDGRNPAWISEAQGYWQVVTAAPVPAPPLAALRPQLPVQLGQGVFVVQEKNEGTFLSGEGELPFAATPGTRRIFVDLSGPQGSWASIDYGDGQSAPQVFVGVQTSFAEFQVQQRGGDRPVAAVKTQSIKCPNCGGDLPVLSPGSERMACKYCNAISDVKLQQVVAQQAQAREGPSIELGRRGVVPVADAKGVYNVEWTVLGYMERSTGSPGSDDWFGWQEYLLYNAQHGYRWLVFDEGNFLLVTPLAAGDVDASRAPVFVNHRNLHFQRRNAQQARVDYVVGEFYWKVAVGESVWAEDYVHGREVVSSERTETEVSWSHSVVIPTAVVTQAFGYQPKASQYGAAVVGGGGGANGLVGLIVVIVVVLVFAGVACGSCGDDGTSSSSSSSSTGGIYTTSGGIRSGSSSGGGFGGK